MVWDSLGGVFGRKKVGVGNCVMTKFLDASDLEVSSLKVQGIKKIAFDGVAHKGVKSPLD